jgi:site-specific DNA-adenine methylase
MQSKLYYFIQRLQAGNYILSCSDFLSFNAADLDDTSLVYCDPPYLITCATYNEQNGWNEKREHDLLALLDNFTLRDIKFALSNVLSNKGKRNQILSNWLHDRNYRIININKEYFNSNYHTKDKSISTDEVLIINY